MESIKRRGAWSDERSDTEDSGSTRRSQPLIDVHNDNHTSFGRRRTPGRPIQPEPFDNDIGNDPYDLTLLVRENARLMRENSELRAKYEDADDNTQWHTLHRIDCHLAHGVRVYSDKPVSLQQDDHDHVDSHRRIPDVLAWEAAHKDLPFVVCKTYCCRETISEVDMPEPDVIGEYVRISSATLRSTVGRLFESHDGLSAYIHEDFLDDGVLHSPYVFLFHFREEINTFLITAGMDRAALALLLRYMEQQSADAQRNAISLFGRGLTSAATMEYLFPPKGLLSTTRNGEVVVLRQASLLQQYENSSMTQNGEDLVFRQVSRLQPYKNRDRGPMDWECKARLVVFNGDFRTQETSIHMSIRQDGTIPITELPTYPIQYMSESLRKTILDRGCRFWACRDREYVTCPTASQSERDHMGEARYMVDVRAYHMLHPRKDPVNSTGEKREQPHFTPRPDDEEFLLQLPPAIQGFRMVDKKWVNLRVADTKPVAGHWNKKAFDALVIENDHDADTKQLIRALVQNKIEADEGIDFVEGKGTGLVLLLHGAPGTGKTLTAESVAEIAEKPLYRVTCGDIGTKPEDVEVYLESVFMLGRRWNCVVLLDEADVFLEERSLDNLERNALVSVFLRAMEYYDGILILTSNRVGHFDEAFKSRVQLALPYRPLTDGQRLRIWKNFIDKLTDVDERMDLDAIRQEVNKLACHPLNGRQIRNAINTGRQLARFSKVPLGLQHLERAIAVSRQFDDYIESVQHEGITAEEMAKERGDRNDGYFRGKSSGSKRGQKQR